MSQLFSSLAGAVSSALAGERSKEVCDSRTADVSKGLVPLRRTVSLSEASSITSGRKNQNPWLQHYAEVAPEHIRKWLNLSEGSGAVPYQTLLENLNSSGIPGKDVSSYTPQELMGYPSTIQVPVRRAILQRSSSLQNDVSDNSLMQEVTPECERLPVTATTRSFIGPVPDRRNQILPFSGAPPVGFLRPGPGSQAPANFLEVAHSKRVEILQDDQSFREIKTHDSNALSPVVHEMSSGIQQRNDGSIQRPPPIFLKPANATSSIIPSIPPATTQHFLHNTLPKTIDSARLHSVISQTDDAKTEEEREVMEIMNRPVVYSLGKYIWSKEEAEGTQSHIKVPAIDPLQQFIVPGAVTIPGVASPTHENQEKENISEENCHISEKEDEIAVSGEDLALPAVIDLCQKLKEKLKDVENASKIEICDDATIEGENKQGMFAKEAFKKGAVVFVDKPIFTVDLDLDKMWESFLSLDDETKKLIKELDGDSKEMVDEDLLQCYVQCRVSDRLELVKEFREFVAKMRRNAHGLPSGRKWGIYKYGVKANHSCDPNVTYRNVDGLLVYIAVRDIQAGEPITITYVDNIFSGTEDRKRRLRKKKAFECQCHRCRDNTQKERQILCPDCRPVKLVIKDCEKSKSEKEVSASEKILNSTFSDSKEEKEEEGNSKENDDNVIDEEVRMGEEQSSGILKTTKDLDDGALASDQESDTTKDFSASSSDGAVSSDAECSDFSNESGKKKVLSKLQKIEHMDTMCSSGKDDSSAFASSEDESSCMNSDDEAESSKEEVKTIVEAPKKLGGPIYCVYDGPDRWICSCCGNVFTDEDMPVGMEEYFTSLYTDLAETFNAGTHEQWHEECSALVRSIEKVLGTRHWLYAATHYLLAQYYLGLWSGGVVLDSIFDRALEHADLFLNFVKSTSPESMHIDCVPLITSLMRIMLFNGRWRKFVRWVEQENVLDSIRDCYGYWDEVFVSFKGAYLYITTKVPAGRLPQLAKLHRFAHTSQFSIVKEFEIAEREIAERKKKEKEEEERRMLIERAEKEKTKSIDPLKIIQEETVKFFEAKSKEYEQQERQKGEEQRIRQEIMKKKMDAQADVKSSEQELFENLKKNDFMEMTLFHPQSVFQRSSFGIGVSGVAADMAYRQAQNMQEAAVNGRFDPAKSKPGSQQNKYLPLIMLADPMGAIKEQQQMKKLLAKKDDISMKKQQRKMERELQRAFGERHTYDDDDDEDNDEDDEGSVTEEKKEGEAEEELSFIYKVPGLHGTAPGEFVTISQLNHSKDGSFPDIPFFKNFFYINEEARQINPDCKDLSLQVLGPGSAYTKVPTVEVLEASRDKYLEEEKKSIEQEMIAEDILEQRQKEKDASVSKMCENEKAENEESPQPIVLRTEAAERIRLSEEASLKEMAARRAFFEEKRREQIEKQKALEQERELMQMKASAAKVETEAAKVVESVPLEPENSYRIIPSEEEGKGPTVLLFKPEDVPIPSINSHHFSQRNTVSAVITPSPDDVLGHRSELRYHPANTMESTLRPRKKLDFSNIPPLPKVDFKNMPSSSHSLYRMNRMNKDWHLNHIRLPSNPQTKSSETLS